MNTFGIRRGNPTPEEIAIAISVLHASAAATGIDAATAGKSRSAWAAPMRLHRPAIHRVGHGAWTLTQRTR